MPKDKDQQIAESKEQPTDEATEDRVDVDTDDEEEEEVQGHISQADVWPRGTNNWKRRK